MPVALPSCGARGAEPWQRRVWHGLQGRVQAEDVVGAGVVAGITEEEEVLIEIGFRRTKTGSSKRTAVFPLAADASCLRR